MALSNGQWGALGAGAAGLGLSGLNNQNPADAAQQYYNQIPGVLNNTYSGYINAGNNALPQMQNQYSNLLSNPTGTMSSINSQSPYQNLLANPGGFINDIGSNYHQSPGFQFALQQALQGANHAASAGGMAGSPQHEQQNMGVATGLANQDYNNYIQNSLGAYNTGAQENQNWMTGGLGQYGQGLSGEQNIYNTGYGASNEYGQSLANALQSQGSLAFQGQAQQNQNQGDIFGSLANLAGTVFNYI